MAFSQSCGSCGRGFLVRYILECRTSVVRELLRNLQVERSVRFLAALPFLTRRAGLVVCLELTLQETVEELTRHFHGYLLKVWFVPPRLCGHR